jgi:hypothetical protein
MILPAYGALPGDASVSVTKHVPYFVSIVSPTTGSRGSSMSWKSFQSGVSIVTMNRLMVHMMQDGVAGRSGLPASSSATHRVSPGPPVRASLRDRTAGELTRSTK